jgi:hypothetical protein
LSLAVTGHGRIVVACLLTAAALAVSSCGGDGVPSANSAATDIPGAACPEVIAWERPPGENLFANPSFEDGAGPWCSLSTEAWGPPFTVSSKRAHTGKSSASLELRSEEGVDTRVVGVVSEVAPAEFPELISGYYYVDRWEQGTPKQYLQMVVIVWQAANIPQEATALGATNHQIRYIMAGVDSQPTHIGNARYVMVSRDKPKTGQWVSFERNVRQDFQDLWGAVPEDFAKIRILFEVRWDDRQPSDGVTAADVYYDDLYLGPAGGMP